MHSVVAPRTGKPLEPGATATSQNPSQGASAARLSYWRRTGLRLLVLYLFILGTGWYFFGSTIKDNFRRTVERARQATAKPSFSGNNNATETIKAIAKLLHMKRPDSWTSMNGSASETKKAAEVSEANQTVDNLSSTPSPAASPSPDTANKCTAQKPCHIMVEVINFIAGERFNYDTKIKCSPEVECHWCSTGTCPGGKEADGYAYDLYGTQWPPGHIPRAGAITLAATIESGAFMGARSVKEAHKFFDVVMTCDPQSDVPLVYLAWGDQLNLPDKAEPSIVGRRPVAAFVASNCENRRKQMVERIIQAGLPVHALGGCVPNGAQHRRIVSNKHPYAAKVEALLNYSVYLAFENSVADGYVTEKVFDGLRAGAITVYRGTKTVLNYVPNNSIIQFDEEQDFKTQVDNIKSYLNPGKYSRLQAWRKVPFYPTAFYWKDLSSHCRGCMAVAELKKLPKEELEARRQRRRDS